MAEERLMTRSMISGVSAFAYPVGARFCQSEVRSGGIFCQNPRGTKRNFITVIWSVL